MDIVNPDACSVDWDGFFALVNAETYEGFVGADWTLDSLVAHIARRRAQESIAVVYVGQDFSGQRVDVRAAPSGKASVADVTSFLTVTGDGLRVADYTDLSMAAQFADSVAVPSPDRSAQLQVAPGRYRLLFRRLRDQYPRELLDEESDEDPVVEVLEVVVSPATPDEADRGPADGGLPWMPW